MTGPQPESALLTTEEALAVRELIHDFTGPDWEPIKLKLDRVVGAA